MTDSSCNRTEPNRITRPSFITKKRAGHPRKIYTSVLFDQEAPRIGRKNVYIRLVVYGSHNKKQLEMSSPIRFYDHPLVKYS